MHSNCTISRLQLHSIQTNCSYWYSIGRVKADTHFRLFSGEDIIECPHVIRPNMHDILTRHSLGPMYIDEIDSLPIHFRALCSVSVIALTICFPSY